MLVVLAIIKALLERNEVDVRLLERIVKQEQAALAELYDRYAPLVYTLVIRIVKSAPDAEDLLQEIFLQVWNKANTFVQTKGSVYTWIVTIARNKAIDRLRGADKPQRDAGVGDEMLLSLRDETAMANPLMTTISSEYEKMMRDGLATLSAEQRTVIEMSYYEGLTQAQISDQLNIPLGTVKTRMRNGIIKLRDFLKERIEK